LDGEVLGHHVLRPIDDETYYYDRSESGIDPPDEFDPAHAADASHVSLRVLLDVDPGSTPERTCQLVSMGAGQCQMGGAPADELPPEPPRKKRASLDKTVELRPARVPLRYALAGPSRLSTHMESHDGAASWIVGILTAGLVIPTGISKSEEYVLVQTVRSKS
jgi:hypothetical protein